MQDHAREVVLEARAVEELPLRVVDRAVDAEPVDLHIADEFRIERIGRVEDAQAPLHVRIFLGDAGAKLAVRQQHLVGDAEHLVGARCRAVLDLVLEDRLLRIADVEDREAVIAVDAGCGDEADPVLDMDLEGVAPAAEVRMADEADILCLLRPRFLQCMRRVVVLARSAGRVRFVMRS
jgi:hypothetical protein